MTELNDIAHAGLADGATELRFPVAYSHGGFAQLRRAVAGPDLNPLGPIRVPAELDATVVANAARTFAAIFLRS